MPMQLIAETWGFMDRLIAQSAESATSAVAEQSSLCDADTVPARRQPAATLACLKKSAGIACCKRHTN